jgi:hypothetical protein
MFAVCLSGHYDDGLMLEDGRVQDMSWDFVWFYGIEKYEDKYEIEVRIPFKSIRYKAGLDEWGLQLRRWHIKDYAVSMWTTVLQETGMQISNFGTLKNVHPKSKGYYIELFPEAYFRYDKIGDSTEYKPSLSLNFKWDPTSQMTINGTINPDFAHIESDPYTFNLSRYPIRLDERRPFFIEGNEIFRMSHLGLGFFNSLDIFYTRLVGKPLADGGYVPILGGLKMINKGSDWNFGVLGAYTDSVDQEPNRGFMVGRVNRSILQSSDIGVLFSGTRTSPDDYNLALGVDGALRSGASQFILQSAVSDKNRKRGWAVSSGGIHRSSNFIAVGSFIAVDDSFDVWDMGYIPWQGITDLYLAAGPARYPETGPILRMYLEPGFVLTKYPESDEWSKFVSLFFEPNFRNMWGFNIYGQVGDQHEADTNYFYRSLDLSIWSGLRTSYNLHFGFNYAHRYNYYRSSIYQEPWIASQFWLWHWMSFVPTSRVSLITEGDFVMEWDPYGELHAITPIWIPRIEYQITAQMDISLYSEFVFVTEEGRLNTAEIYSNRIGFLFSWNFSPKSWFYVAFNDLREDTGEGLELTERIGAVKIKYLLYF